MKVLDLFCGTKSISNAFKERGHQVFTVDWEKSFEPDLVADIGQLTAGDIIKLCGGVPDVIWASPDCFTAGTLVWTSKGYKDIKDVECGDLVLTHLGNYKKVYRTIKKNTYKFCNIKIAGCEEFLVTPNHPFYVRKKKRINTHRNGKSIVYTELLQPEWVNAENLTNEYRVGIPINNNSIIPNWEGVVKYRYNLYGKTSSWIENNLSKYLDKEDFWWLIGRYIGDGSVSSDKGIVEICCAKEECNEILSHLLSLGIDYKYREKKTASAYYFCSKEWCEFVLQFGCGSLNKAITPEILDLPMHLLRSFLEGYISADGYWDNRYKNPCCKITTVSKKLAYGLQMCLLKVYGVYASLVVNDNPNNVIEGRKVNAHKSYNLGFYKEYNSKRSHYVIENGMAWVNIKNNQLVNTEQKSIYTLSVEDDESYTANNVSVHNCTTYSVAAISRHRKKDASGNLEPISEYAKFCDKVNKHFIEVIKQLNPKYWFIENPRAGFRKMDFVKDLPRYTVTYCQYGDFRQKPTDIFTNHPNPKFKPPCKNGDPCHEPAPRGSRTGTQGIKGAIEKARIPKLLCEWIVKICEG